MAIPTDPVIVLPGDSATVSGPLVIEWQESTLIDEAPDAPTNFALVVEETPDAPTNFDLVVVETADYETDFASQSLGAPTDWSAIKRNAGNEPTLAIVDIADGPGGSAARVLRFSTLENDRQGTLWDTISADAGKADTETLMLARFATRLENHQLRPMVRFTGDLADGSHSYQAGPENGGGGTNIHGVFRGTTLLNSKAQATAEGDWWYLHFRVNGSDLRFSSWPYGGTEPASWEVSATDATIATGNVGLFTFEGGAVIEVAKAWASTGGRPILT